MSPTAKVLDKMKILQRMYAHGGPAAPPDSTPHVGQEILHRSNARYRVSVWGRRAGKSFGGATDAMPNLLSKHSDGFPQIGWIVAPNYELGEREFRVLWHHAVLKLGIPMEYKHYVKASGQMSFKTEWGAEVHVKSAEKPDKSLLGEGLSWCILAEAARLDRSVWDQYIEPSLADRNGKALFTTTPQGINWIYVMYLRGQNPDFPHWNSFQFPSWVNTYRFPGGLQFRNTNTGLIVPWEEVAANPNQPVLPTEDSNEKLVESWKTLSRHYFWQEYGAQFRTQAGRIYPDFDPGYHVGHYPFKSGRRNYRTIDYGTTNPFVCLDIQVDEFDNVYVWREWRRIGHTTMDNVRWAGVPADLGYDLEAVIGDPYEPDGRLTTENEWGIPCQFLPLGVKNGIELVTRWLNMHPSLDGQMKPKLFINESCQAMIEEMKAYRWKQTLDEELFVDQQFQLSGEDNPKEEPLKQNDHAPDALRNFMAWMYGSTLVMHGEQNEAYNEGESIEITDLERWWSDSEQEAERRAKARHERQKRDRNMDSFST